MAGAGAATSDMMSGWRLADERVPYGSVYNWCVKNVSVTRHYLYPQRGR